MNWTRSLMIGLGFGAAVGVFMCYIALDHSPQGEFADPETGAFTSDLYVLFAVSSAFIGLPIALVLGVASHFMRCGD